MLFLSGAASSVLDYLMSMQSATQGAQQTSGTANSSDGDFTLNPSAGTNTATADAATTAAGTGGIPPWWSSPGTMGALLTAQGQSGTGSGGTESLNQLFASLDSGSGSNGTTSGGANGIQNWWSSLGSANGLFGTQNQSGVGAPSGNGIDQLFATLESGAGLNGTGSGTGLNGPPNWWSTLGSANSLLGAQGQSGVGNNTTSSLNQLFASLESSAGISVSNPSDGSGNSNGDVCGSGDGGGQSGTVGQPTSQTVTNADGSTTTTLTYSDGSTVTMTTPAAPNGSATGPTSGTSSNAFAGNMLERLIQQQAQLFAPAAGKALSTLA